MEKLLEEVDDNVDNIRCAPGVRCHGGPHDICTQDNCGNGYHKVDEVQSLDHIGLPPEF